LENLICSNVSQRQRRPVRPSCLTAPMRLSIVSSLLAIAFSLVGAPMLHAQYPEYPRQIGEYQSLASKALPKWVKFDVELRSRVEYQSAMNLIPNEHDAYDLTRVRGGAQIRATHWASLYVQFQDAHALALPAPNRAANMWDTFDLRQGYLDLHHRNVTFVAGRQELRYGDERVIGVSDWTNIGRTWDGFLLRIGNQRSKNKLDLFTTSVVSVYPRSLDTHGAGLTFHGAVGTITTPLPKTTVQPFLFVRTAPRVKSQQGIYGEEHRFTPGIIFMREQKSGLDYEITATLQRGIYSNDAIRAGSAIVKVGYTSDSLPLNPHIGFEYDYATGNPRHNPNRMSTNDQLYPSNHNAFGLVDLFGFQNLEQLRGSLDLTPAKDLSVFLQTGSLRVATAGDGIYNAAGTLLVNGPLPGRGIGTELDASLKYLYTKSFIVDAGIGHFFPGQAIKQNGSTTPFTIAYFGLTYRFRIE